MIAGATLRTRTSSASDRPAAGPAGPRPCPCPSRDPRIAVHRRSRPSLTRPSGPSDLAARDPCRCRVLLPTLTDGHHHVRIGPDPPSAPSAPVRDPCWSRAAPCRIVAIDGHRRGQTALPSFDPCRYRAGSRRGRGPACRVHRVARGRTCSARGGTFSRPPSRDSAPRPCDIPSLREGPADRLREGPSLREGPAPCDIPPPHLTSWRTFLFHFHRHLHPGRSRS